MCIEQHQSHSFPGPMGDYISDITITFSCSPTRGYRCAGTTIQRVRAKWYRQPTVSQLIHHGYMTKHHCVPEGLFAREWDQQAVRIPYRTDACNPQNNRQPSGGGGGCNGRDCQHRQQVPMPTPDPPPASVHSRDQHNDPNTIHPEGGRPRQPEERNEQAPSHDDAGFSLPREDPVAPMSAPPSVQGHRSPELGGGSQRSGRQGDRSRPPSESQSTRPAGGPPEGHSGPPSLPRSPLEGTFGPPPPLPRGPPEGHSGPPPLPRSPPERHFGPPPPLPGGPPPPPQAQPQAYGRPNRLPPQPAPAPPFFQFGQAQEQYLLYINGRWEVIEEVNYGAGAGGGGRDHHYGGAYPYDYGVDYEQFPPFGQQYHHNVSYGHPGEGYNRGMGYCY